MKIRQELLENRAACARTRTAFTIIELVAVLGMIALMAVILSPVLARSYQSGNAARCLNNLRQLSMGWKMYADDCRGRFAPNLDGSAAGRSNRSWAGGWLDFSSVNTDNTNVALLLDHNLYPNGAYLGPYVRTAEAFKCPSDNSKSDITSPPSPRVRTYSMSNRVGDQARSWTGNSAYLMYTTLGSLTSPKPAELFVFVEEREDGINDPTFLVDPDNLYNVVDYPAMYHAASGAFGFADGHSELHRWQDPRTTPVLGSGLTVNVVLTNNSDVVWLQQHSAAKR